MSWLLTPLSNAVLSLKIFVLLQSLCGRPTRTHCSVWRSVLAWLEGHTKFNFGLKVLHGTCSLYSFDVKWKRINRSVSCRPLDMFLSWRFAAGWQLHDLGRSMKYDVLLVCVSSCCAALVTWCNIMTVHVFLHVNCSNRTSGCVCVCIDQDTLLCSCWRWLVDCTHADKTSRSLLLGKYC